MSAYLLACLCLLPSADAAKVKWETDLEAAGKLAKEQKKPMFVVFRCDH
jgi:hypothetical protein